MSWLRRAVAAAAVGVLLTAAANADEVRIVGTDLEAIESRVELVLDAQREILASSFVFGEDPLTLTSLSLLRDAARRGLTVRILADALWNKIPEPVIAHLLAEGVEIREYHPLRLARLGTISRRLHDKVVIADGSVLLAGGRNVQSTYFGFGHQIGARNYIDLDLMVRGRAAADARQYFLALWASGSTRAVRPRADAAEIERASRELDRHEAWLAERIEQARSDPARVPLPFTEAGAVRFLHDPVPGAPAERKVAAELRDLIDTARESVVIESPYLVTTRAMRAALGDAIARGVRVRILTNSLDSTDNLLPQAAYVAEKPMLVRGGVELWEYRGPECLHTKAAVIDDELVIVGSYNLDPRSQNLNRETVLVLRDAAVAAEVRRRMDANLERAHRIDTAGRPISDDAPGARTARETSLRFQLLRMIAPLLRGQL